MDDVSAMRLALAEADRAAEHGDVPVGAVVLLGDRVIAARHNEREHAEDPLAHAEMLALRDAAVAIGRWRLDDCALVVTLEPCLMCAGALVNARVGRLVYGAREPKFGAVGSLYDVCRDERLNHRPDVAEGVLADESSQRLKAFFASRRR
jgi:tRNA(adenine34) deaminase